MQLFPQIIDIFTCTLAILLMVHRLLLKLFSQPFNLSLQLFFIVIFTRHVLMRFLHRRLVLFLEHLCPLFLLLERPPNGFIGQQFGIEIMQYNDETNTLIGGLDTRVELHPDPGVEKFFLRLWSTSDAGGGKRIRARLYDQNGRHVSPNENAAVNLKMKTPDGVVKDLGDMPWHGSHKIFYFLTRSLASNGQAPASFTASAPCFL